jgi:hypothetical protein
MFSMADPTMQRAPAIPYSKHGLGYHGLLEVTNFPWIKEAANGNHVHPRHSESSLVSGTSWLAYTFMASYCDCDDNI